MKINYFFLCLAFYFYLPINDGLSKNVNTQLYDESYNLLKDSSNQITILFEGKFNGIGYNELEVFNQDSSTTLKVFRGKMFGTTQIEYKINEQLLDNDSLLNEIKLFRRHRLVGRLQIMQDIPKRLSAEQKYLLIQKTSSFRSRTPYQFQWMTYEDYILSKKIN